MTTNIKFTRATYVALSVAHQAATERDDNVFTFTYDGESHVFNTMYAGYLLEHLAQKFGPLPPPGYTAEELERDNPYNQWMYEA